MSSAQVDEWIRALASDDRGVQLAAIFALGTSFAGRGDAAAAGHDVDAARAISALDAVVADRRTGTSWVRKRAKRALAKIRGLTADDEKGGGEGIPEG
jgi:hypothetical protein